MKTAEYQPRWYRHCCAESKLKQFFVQYRESDLCVRAETDLSSPAYDALTRIRQELETCIASHPEFARSLIPVAVRAEAPDIVKIMARAAIKTGVGPMAAVAGAVNQLIARELSCFSDTLIIENGGDVYVRSPEPVIAAVYAGNSPLSMKIGLKVDARHGVGICTSSGTVGHSLSFGKADAVTVIAEDCALADAAATAIGNRVNEIDDLDPAIATGQSIESIDGVIVIMGARIAAWGKGFEIRKI